MMRIYGLAPFGVLLVACGSPDTWENTESTKEADTSCCLGGDCLCHGEVPPALTADNGPFLTASFPALTGTVYYPLNAPAPFAAISICPGFLNTGPEMTAWGPFYASWGIVTEVTNTGALDLPDERGRKLIGAINELKQQNATLTSPLFGKLSGRYGTSGYSMGGGGTTFASVSDPTLKTSVGLAAWGPTGLGDRVATLFVCSDADLVAACTGSNVAYLEIPLDVPKMVVDIPGASHFNWFSPTDIAAGFGTSGKYALAFQKVYLESDERWKSLLLTPGALGTQITTTIR
jgi:hypothetical protein